jgi:RNA polymerase sigma-70 factor (ECF subfamily)
MIGVDGSIVEDIAQETFAKALKNFSKFDEKKASIKTWLLTIAKNCYKDYFKLKQNKQTSLDKMLDDPKSESSMGINGFLKKMWDEQEYIANTNKLKTQRISRIMHIATQKLGTSQLKAFQLTYVDGLKMYDVAKQMGLSYTNIRKINSKSLAKIKETIRCQ